MNRWISVKTYLNEVGVDLEHHFKREKFKNLTFYVLRGKILAFMALRIRQWTEIVIQYLIV